MFVRFSTTTIPLHPFNGLFSRTTRVSRYQKGKTSLDLNEARDGGVLGWQLHQLDHMQTICTSPQRDNNTNTSSLNFYRPGALPDAQPVVSNVWRVEKMYQLRHRLSRCIKLGCDYRQIFSPFLLENSLSCSLYDADINIASFQSVVSTTPPVSRFGPVNCRVCVCVCVCSRPRYSCIHLSNNGDVLQYRLCKFSVFRRHAQH